MAPRITYSELSQRLDIISKTRNIVMTSSYIDTRSKSDFQCLVCSYKWSTTFNSISRGSGCSICKGCRVTPEVIQKRLETLETRNIKMVDSYKSSSTKNNFRCLISDCNHTWKAVSGAVIMGNSGCPKCSGNLVGINEKIKRVKELENRGVKLIGELGVLSHRYDFRCLKSECGYIWKTPFKSVYDLGTGCPKCAGKIIDNNEKTLRINSLIERQIKLLGEFTFSKTKHNFKCLKHDCSHIWQASFYSVYNRSTGCPRCNGKCKTEEEKLKTYINRKLRSRMSTLYYRGSIPTKKDKSNMSDQLRDYWFEQCKNIPDRPGNGYDLDHIIPIDKFDPNDLESMKLCWDYRNFQWLTSEENSSKSNKLMSRYFTAWHYKTLDKIGVTFAS